MRELQCKPVVLLDVDGVLADFVTPVLAEINARTGGEYTYEEINGWDIYAALNVDPTVGRLVDNVIQQPGFCAGLREYPGVAKFLELLRERADVIAVTAPFEGAHWIGERLTWLADRGFSKRDIVFTNRKELVRGDYLIDDKASTVGTWEDVHPLGRGILYNRPWNRRERNLGYFAADNFEGVLSAIEEDQRDRS